MSDFNDQPNKTIGVAKEETVAGKLEQLYSRIINVEDNLGISSLDKPEKETVRPDKINITIQVLSSMIEKMEVIGLVTRKL